MITLQLQRKVGFEFASFSRSKREVSAAKSEVQAPTGSTEKDDERTGPLCQIQEEDVNVEEEGDA